MLAILLLAGLAVGAAERVASAASCESPSSTWLRCRQASFVEGNLPLKNRTDYARITQLEWIESGVYLLADHLFQSVPNLHNVSLRANALVSLTALPFWSYLRSISHLDLSQNRLVTITARDFQGFESLISLNLSSNFLTTVEPVWLFRSIRTIDLSENGINAVGYFQVQNSTSELHSCRLEQVFLSENRGLLSLAQLQTTIMDVCPFLDRLQLMNNHWHCACTDLVDSLKRYRTLILLDDSSQTLTGPCETPLSFRHVDIQQINENFVCDQLLLFDPAVTDEQSTSPVPLPRQIIGLFIMGCIIGIIIGVCLRYCAGRCLDILSCILFKCDRQKAVSEGHSNDAMQMSDASRHANRFIYCPTMEADALPTYSQVMNDIFYLDILARPQQAETDGEC